MKTAMRAFIYLGGLTLLMGCANDAPLGKSVYLLKEEQTYNKNATEENLGFVPTGSEMKEDMPEME